MKENTKGRLGSCVDIFLGLLAVVAIKSLFESDSSKIVSKKGRNLLSDEAEMKAIIKKIHDSEKKDNNKEVFI